MAATAADPGMKKFLTTNLSAALQAKLGAKKIRPPHGFSDRITQESDSTIHSARAIPGQAAHRIKGSFP